MGVIDFITSICETSHLAYVHGFVIPVIEKFFKFPIIQVGNSVRDTIDRSDANLCFILSSGRLIQCID